MSRIVAREIAMHMLYELSFGKNQPEELLSERMNEEAFSLLREESKPYDKELTEADRAYIRQVVAGATEKKAEIDEMLLRYAEQWKPSRLSKITGSILRLSIYEILYVEGMPPGAAVNAAVELAKQYDADEAPAFINGILGAFCRGEKRL